MAHFERLSREMLFEITKYKQCSKQIEWLQQRGIPFQLDRYNHPIVCEEAIFGSKRQVIKQQKIQSKTTWQSPIKVAPPIN